MGAGMGFNLGISSGTLGFGSLGGLAAPAVIGSTSVEYRVADSVSLSMGVAFGYSKDFDEPDSSLSVAESIHLGGSIGVRWIVNPGDVVEVGFPFELAADWASSTFETENSSSEQAAVSAAIRAGIAADLRLTDQLRLRVRTSILSAAVSKKDDDGARVSVGLDLRPELQLRVLF